MDTGAAEALGGGFADADTVGAACTVVMVVVVAVSRPREKAFASRLLVVLVGRGVWEEALFASVRSDDSL